MRVLDLSQLERLSSHKYSSSGTSILEPYFQVFWNHLIQYIPKTIAPNALTITGLILNIVSTLILIYYSPDGASYISPLPLVFAAISLFIYQTLDALDGKQARRTGSSSPLGELFDHGCDAFSTLFVSLGTSLAIGLGHYPYLMLAEVLISVSLFYMAQWQCYVTGTLEFGTVDVTEAQLLVMTLYSTSAAVGVNFWSIRPVPALAIELKHLMVIGTILPAIWMCFRFLKTILRDGVGRNGTTVANTSVVFPCCPIGFVVITAVLTATRKKSYLFLNHRCLFLMTFGMVASKLTNKLVVGHMTRSEITFMDWILLGPLAIFFNQYFDCPIREDYLLWAVFAWSTFDALKYGVLVCRQIAEHLNIYIFVLGRREEDDSNNACTIPSGGVASKGQEVSGTKRSLSPYDLRRRQARP